MTRHTVGTREEWRTARCSVADGPLLVGLAIASRRCESDTKEERR